MNKSDYSFLVAAFVSFIFSISLWFGVVGNDLEVAKQSAIFVGLWVPSILALGLYFKLSNKGTV